MNRILIALVALLLPALSFGQKITDLPAATDAADGDLIEIVDVSDTSTALTGRNEKASILTLKGVFQPFDSDLTTYSGITPSANVQTLLGAADFAAFKVSLSLGNVENTAISTFAGSSNIITLGTVTTGTWNGTIIGPTYLGTGSSITTKYLRGDGTWQTISGGGDALTSGNLSQFAATTSAQLSGVLTNESGTGVFVLDTSATLTTPTISGAITFPDGTRQTFNPNGTASGLNVGSHTADPSTPTNGDIWYDSALDLLRARVGGTTVSIAGDDIDFGGAADLSIMAIDENDTPSYITTASGINAVTSDDDFLTLTGTQTSTNKTFTNPIINGGAVNTHSETFTVLEPDAVQGVSDDVILKKFVAEKYPNGVTIVAIHIDASAAYTSETFLFEHWDDASGSTQATVESITASAISTEDDGTLSDATIPADYFLVVNLDGTPEDKAYVSITIVYTVD